MKTNNNNNNVNTNNFYLCLCWVWIKSLRGFFQGKSFYNLLFASIYKINQIIFF